MVRRGNDPRNDRLMLAQGDVAVQRDPKTQLEFGLAESIAGRQYDSALRGDN
jgi:hypothetical protein